MWPPLRDGSWVGRSRCVRKASRSRSPTPSGRGSFPEIPEPEASALLAACGVVAAFVPARRAARVNPAIALRAE